MKTKFLIILALLILLIVSVVMLLNNDQSIDSNNQNVSVTGDPMDTASGFYNDWLSAKQSTTTDPYEAGLALDSRLVESVHQYLADRQADDKDPVLCLLNDPPRIGSKTVFQVDGSAQLIMLARGLSEPVTQNALVDLEVIEGEWKITNISCTNSEVAPEREFSFEKTGFLLQSGESGLDPNIWYLVFEENGIDGHTAPLYFSETSTCQSADGAEEVCSPDQFTNPSQAVVKGDMTEVGVEVNRVELVN